jgi:glycosyltransferase involved in cell wall biosynthesis
LSLLRFDGELCNGITSSRDCIQCLGQESGFYRKLDTFLPEGLTIEVLNIISKFSTLNRQRGLRGTALNIDQRKAYLKEMINLADVITAPSNHLANTILETRITNSIRVIQSGHDLTWLDSEVTEKPSDQVRFGYIGQITSIKGVHILISAFLASEFNNNAELHIYGNFKNDPGYMEELQNIAGPNGNAISFHGSFPHSKLGIILAEIDMLIVPSLWHENNPRVIQEAYAGKTPVIASDVGGISEYVEHGINGFLFERGNVDDLGAIINMLIEKPKMITQLKSHLPKVKSMEDEMNEFEIIYRTLLPQSEDK